MRACLTWTRLALRDPYADDRLWMNLMTERVEAQRETVKLYQSSVLNDDLQEVEIKLGSGLNEFGQSKNSLQAQGGCMQTYCMSPRMLGAKPNAKAVSGALSLPRLFCAALYGVFGILLLRLENFLPEGRLHDGVLSLPRCIHYQKAIDDFPVNDFGAHARLFHVTAPQSEPGAARLLAARVLTVLAVRTEMCFKVSEDYGNVVAAWRAAVDIATTYIRDGRHAHTAVMTVVLHHELSQSAALAR